MSFFSQMDFAKLLAGLRRRSGFLLKKASLDLKLGRKDVAWIDYGYVRLPYHGDGDAQEVFYHLYANSWWHHELKTLSPYLRKGMVSIDVGANIGFISAIISRAVGEHGSVHSFEPSPRTFHKLVEFVAQNDLANVHPHNYGCGQSEASMQLAEAKSSGSSSLSPRAEMELRGTQQVHIVDLDTFLGDRFGRIDFLKIDTEGFEDMVLLGAENIISNHRPVIYIELGADYRESSLRAIEILNRHGYTFTTQPVLDSSRGSDNYFAVPSIEKV